jgi:hypothetical protein
MSYGLEAQRLEWIDYGSEGWGFESLQAHENPAGSHVSRGFYFSDRYAVTVSTSGLKPAFR